MLMSWSHLVDALLNNASHHPILYRLSPAPKRVSFGAQLTRLQYSFVFFSLTAVVKVSSSGQRKAFVLGDTASLSLSFASITVANIRLFPSSALEILRSEKSFKTRRVVIAVLVEICIPQGRVHLIKSGACRQGISI